MPMRVKAIVAALPFLALLTATAANSQNRATEAVPPARVLKGPDATSATPTLKTLYRFSGVRDGNAGPWAIATAVMCSNVTGNPINAVLRIFGVAGTQYANAAFVVPPSNTYTVVTRTIPTYPAQLNLGLSAVSQGLGVIASDREGLRCTAQVIDALNSPPTFVGSLNMERASF